MKPYQFGKKQKLLWGLFLLCAWGTVILLFSRHHGGFTAKELANYKPDNPLLSCLVMLGLFALKSVDFLMHSGVLYAASGIMFPLPAALLLNTVGIMITVTPTYFLGKAWGPPVIETLCRKYPRLRVFADDQKGGSLAVAILLRTVGLPIQVGSVYMGAANYRFGGDDSLHDHGRQRGQARLSRLRHRTCDRNHSALRVGPDFCRYRKAALVRQYRSGK